MGLFGDNKRAGGFMDEIRCDEPSYLIWKWHPAGSQPGNNRRENAIRCGSSLRVKEGEVAVFVCEQDGIPIQDYIVGPYDETVKTSNFPVLASIIGLAYDGGTPFQAEIYFINLARIIQVKFGVPFFDVYDPRFADFGVPVAVRGTISFKIDDYREFIKLHRLNSFNLDEFQKQIRDAVIRYVKDTVANAPATNNIPLVQIETKIAQINDVIEYDIGERLKENFGVTVSGVDIGAIELDKTSDGYLQLTAVTKELTAATAQAQTAANIKNIHDKQRIEAENYQETLRVQREEGQYAQHKQTQTSNFAAYQTEAQTQVGVAGANALGQMGANGAGGVGPRQGYTIIERVLQKSCIVLPHETVETFAAPAAILGNRVGNDFMQCHRSFYVSLRKIRGFQPDHFLLEGDVKVPIGRTFLSVSEKAFLNISKRLLSAGV